MGRAISAELRQLVVFQAFELHLRANSIAGLNKISIRSVKRILKDFRERRSYNTIILKYFLFHNPKLKKKEIK